MLYDDRPKVSPGVKFKDAELLGMPTIVTVGRGLADGTIEVRDRATGEREEVPVADAATRVLAAVQRLIGRPDGAFRGVWHNGGSNTAVAALSPFPARVHGSAPA